jgi:hypothetical protein
MAAIGMLDVVEIYPLRKGFPAGKLRYPSNPACWVGARDVRDLNSTERCYHDTRAKWHVRKAKLDVSTSRPWLWEGLC